MNRKGAYSGIIASIAIVAIIAVAFSSSATVKAQSENDYSKAIVDVKRNWGNARYLLDKSASDALADDSYETSATCNIAYDEMANYFNTVLNNSIKNCEVTQGPDVTPGADLTVTATISCSKQLNELNKVIYEKGVEFIKRVKTFYDGSQCLVDVLDKQSDVCEVDKILAAPPTGLCTAS